jgi:RNA polymerase sigma factor (TIGR02999 family)
MYTRRHDVSGTVGGSTPNGPERGELTTLLCGARAGDAAAADALFARVYHELHHLAQVQLRAHGRPGVTLNTTALVHEAYLRLATPAGLAAEDRRHFFNLAARIMRHVIVDFARRRDAEQRGGGMILVGIEAAGSVGSEDASLSVELLTLDDALRELETQSPELARLVELRFFAGLPLPEVGELLGRSATSLKRDWRRARAFLQTALSGRT